MSNFSLFLLKMLAICAGLFGFATNTYDQLWQIGQTHLEYVERFKLDVPALITQKVHHHLEVRFRADIPGHDVVIGSVEEDLSQEFE